MRPREKMYLLKGHKHKNFGNLATSPVVLR